ncbi:nucleoside transporter, partial [Dictyocaulus viviparus]
SESDRPTNEEDAFIQNIPNKNAPKDVGNIVYLIIMLHGVGTLMPWNMFITIAPNVSYSIWRFSNFYFFTFINIPLRLGKDFVTFKGDLTKRISFSMLIVGLMIVFTMSFVYVDTWSFSDNIPNAAFAYFGISLVTLCSCFASFFFLKKQLFYQHYSKLAMSAQVEGSDRKPELTASDYLDTLKQGWPQLVNIYLVFFVSLTIFPGIMVDIRDELVGEKYSFIIPEKFFTPITCFLLFNVFAFVGSMLAGHFQFPGPEHLWIAVYTRLLFIPFFAFCNYRPLSRRYPVLFTSTSLYVIMAILMSISSGYLSGLAMMFAPRVVEPSKSRIVSMIAGFFLIFGIISGLSFTILVSALIQG